MQKRFVLCVFCGLVSASVSAGEIVTYYYTDAQGTVLAKTDAAGNITVAMDNKPYGDIALGVAVDGPGYTGHVNDPDTGLVYMQARYYDPQVGRFLTVDPLGPSAGDAFTFNRYDYASNNPIINVDPNGKAACPGQSARSCLQADVSPGDASRLSGRTVTASAQVGAAMVAGKNVVAVRKNDPRDEKVGFVVATADGGSKVVPATSVVTTSEARRDTAKAPIPSGAEAVIHGHIDGRSDGIVSDRNGEGDFEAVDQHSLPNGVVSLGRVGVNELVKGVPQLRMLSGTMNAHEVQATQANLNRVLQGNFLLPEPTSNP